MESTANLFPVAPINPPAPYQGGKRNLAKRITGLIDRVPHQVYAEPFVGMGGIFLRRSRRPKMEMINDISGDVVTLFRILQEHYPYFIDLLRWRLSSRAEFERLAGQDPARLTDLQRAARFLYLQRQAFGGKIVGRSFGVSYGRPSRFNVSKLEPMLAEIHERLADVIIEQLPWSQFVARYDRRETLFYLDPPYWNCEDDYGGGLFGRADFEAMAEQLGAIAGGFILSINDVPDIREIFGRFRLLEVATSWTISASGSANVGELLVTNLPAELATLPANDR